MTLSNRGHLLIRFDIARSGLDHCRREGERILRYNIETLSGASPPTLSLAAYKRD